jgi:nicotinamidase-related amidase
MTGDSRGEFGWQRPTLWPTAIPSLAIDVNRVGLLVIDLQRAFVDLEALDAGAAELLGAPLATAPTTERWRERIRDQVVPNTAALLCWFRREARPVIFTRVGSLLPDARDQHDKRRTTWLRPALDREPFRLPVGHPAHDVLPALAPGPGETVIDKNSSSAFSSTDIEYRLHRLNVQTIIACGVATNACVDGTVRDAADRGFNVVLVEDACAGPAGNEAAHDDTVRTFGRYFGAVRPAAALLDDLSALADAGALPAGAL